jgi:hypothetical protein
VVLPHHTKSYKFKGTRRVSFHSLSDDSYLRIAHDGLTRRLWS